MRSPRTTKSTIVWPRMLAGLIAACLAAPVAESYPLDGAKRTGIRRLEGYSKAQQREDSGSLVLPPGAQLPTSSIDLHLVGTGATWDLDQMAKNALRTGPE